MKNSMCFVGRVNGEMRKFRLALASALQRVC
jgi:hypothetical protein